MNILSLNLLRIRLNLKVCLPLCGALLASFSLAGCGANVNNVGKGGTDGTTTVTILTTSTANNQLSLFDMSLSSLTLTDQSGNTATLVSSPINADFLHVNGITEPLLTVTLPQGTYTSATASVGASGFACLGIDSSTGDLTRSTFAYGNTPAANVTVNLPSPITISGNSAVLVLDLQVSQSASYDSGDCIATSNYSITPAFTLASAGDASQTEIGLRGLINTIATSGNTFSVTAADGQDCATGATCGSMIDGPLWQIATDANTVYQGISGFSGLGAGMSVDMDAVLQPDGSLHATRIAVYDSDPTNLSMVIGPVVKSEAASPVFLTFATEQLGPLSISFFQYDFSNATFQISGQFSNLQDLPFPANFGPSSMVPGQSVYASTHSPETDSSGVELPPVILSAATVVLLPQTLDGTVSAIGSDGGFTTYTITLAPYDLFPALAVQPGQTTILNNPNTVIVYADDNTQMLNTNPIAVGGVARFYGLLFDDNGTLRMDCGEILDGVPE